MKKISVLVAEDHPLMRDSIVSSLNDSDTGIEVVNQCSNGIELLKALELAVDLPDVILLDIDMPQMDGIEALERIREKYSNEIKILVFSAHESPLISKKNLKLGAEGLIYKSSHPSKLIQTIVDLYEGAAFYQKSSVIKGRSKKHGNNDIVNVEDLSEIEINILKMICEESSVEQIADALCISTNTVNSYRTRMLSKTNSKSIAGLVVYAIRNDIFNPKAG